MPIHSSIRFIPVLALLCAACATTVRPVHTPSPGQLMEAAAALQGGVSDLFFRDEDLAVAAIAIEALRRARPDLREIGPHPHGSLELALTDSAWRELAARFPDRSDVVRAPTGLPGIDSVNVELGARGIRLSPYSFSRTIRLIFDRPANIPALAARYSGLPDVEYAGRTEYLGVASTLTVGLSPDTVGLALWRGSGDCLSGCIYNRTWTFRYDRRTGRITQLTDSGDPLPAASLDAGLRQRGRVSHGDRGKRARTPFHRPRPRAPAAGPDAGAARWPQSRPVPYLAREQGGQASHSDRKRGGGAPFS